MSKYNVGDVVKLRDDLEDGEYYGEVAYNKSMDDMRNKPIKICEKCMEDKSYLVEDDVYEWYLTDEMIEGLWEECKPKLKLIDVLNMIAKGELKEGTKVGLRNNVYTFERHYWNDASLSLFRSNGKQSVFEDFCLSHILNDEVELIEPPCEHEWLDWETHRMGEGRIRRYRRCNKCGLEEETDVGKSIEPSKIEELKQLDMDFAEIDFQSHEEYARCAIQVLARHMIKQIDKLNEVIRKINLTE